MWRAFFLACGLTVVLLGVQTLGVERFVLKMRGEPPAKVSPWDNEPKVAPPVEFSPPPWVPWSLLVSGAVTFLYSFTIPKRLGK
jgi:hypothetical protein